MHFSILASSDKLSRPFKREITANGLLRHSDPIFIVQTDPKTEWHVEAGPLHSYVSIPIVAIRSLNDHVDTRRLVQNVYGLANRENFEINTVDANYLVIYLKTGFFLEKNLMILTLTVHGQKKTTDMGSRFLLSTNTDRILALGQLYINCQYCWHWHHCRKIWLTNYK
jgi:hypothetical protein